MLEPHKFSDDHETRLTKNMVHIMEGYTAELCIAVLVKCLTSLLIGLSKDKGSAIKHVATISRHLKKELNNTKDEDFNYLSTDKNNEPILTKEKGLR